MPAIRTASKSEHAAKPYDEPEPVPRVKTPPSSQPSLRWYPGVFSHVFSPPSSPIPVKAIPAKSDHAAEPYDEPEPVPTRVQTPPPSQPSLKRYRDVFARPVSPPSSPIIVEDRPPILREDTPPPSYQSQLSLTDRPFGYKTAIDRFFAQYPEFPFNPARSPTFQLRDLCNRKRWERKDSECETARHAFRAAMKEDFNDIYGLDEHDINNWHRLCLVLDIEPLPQTLAECREAVCQKHVNLVDLVENYTKKVRLFESEEALSKYTRETGKFFPKEDAADGGVLRALRRHILNPRSARDRPHEVTTARNGPFKVPELPQRRPQPQPRQLKPWQATQAT
ncbi:hypothetical protein BC834DRAFT_313574 [Gloeopeniophorella convolvens]|nr:hypothetical protein BC834DRAFT_313574 [Gloeopeniophorella convolvens]